MRVGIRLAISALVLTSILVTALGVHLLWWRTADDTSQTLASTINAQIVGAVEQELVSITTEAKSIYIAISTMIAKNVLPVGDADKREFAFLSQLIAQPTISWVMFGWPDGEFFAAHKLGDSTVETIKVDRAMGMSQQQINRYELAEGDLKLEEHRLGSTSYAVTKQEWFATAMQAEGPQWFKIQTFPEDERPSAGLAGPVDTGQSKRGVLGVMIEYARLSRFLSQLTVGKSGAAFLLDRDGTTIAAPDPDASEITPRRADQPLLPVALSAMKQSVNAPDFDEQSVRRVRETRNDDAYAVTLTPLAFPGWYLATVIPEAEFLGPVQATVRRLVMALAGLIVVAGLLSAWLAQRLISAPLIRVADEIKHVQHFDLDKVTRHVSRIDEIQNLSSAIADMAGGLSAFRKYIPADLVNTLVNSGIEARPDGSIRPMTVMFADIAGFTGLSERLGNRIIPLLSRYLDIMSTRISVENGTVDKFIGDAVMAFWGAPAENPDHALAACKAALASLRALRDAHVTDDQGHPLKIRIGINSGDMLVGNIGSDVRLNYTVIGDAVNVASRLESANKVYSSDIIIGDETRRLAGDRIYVRELDLLAVYGRASGMAIYELLGIAGEDDDPSRWTRLSDQGFTAYRARDFTAAIACFTQLLAARPNDRPSMLMIERCRTYLTSPPGNDWNGITIAQSK